MSSKIDPALAAVLASAVAQPAAPQKSSKTGLYVGIALAVAVVIIAILIAVMMGGGSGSCNPACTGNTKCEKGKCVALTAEEAIARGEDAATGGAGSRCPNVGCKTASCDIQAPIDGIQLKASVSPSDGGGSDGSNNGEGKDYYKDVNELVGRCITLNDIYSPGGKYALKLDKGGWVTAGPVSIPGGIKIDFRQNKNAKWDGVCTDGNGNIKNSRTVDGPGSFDMYSEGRWVAMKVMQRASWRRCDANKAYDNKWKTSSTPTATWEPY